MALSRPLGATAARSLPASDTYELRVHVPISQVWPRSRGVQSGKTHLHVTEWTVIGGNYPFTGEVRSQSVRPVRDVA